MAYIGDDTKQVSSSYLFKMLQSFYTKIQALLTKKADASHTHCYAGSSTIGGSANEAIKLTNARKISLDGQLTGSVSFNGSNDVGLKAWDYNCIVSKGNTNNFPYCRIAHVEGTISYNDRVMLLYVSQSYKSGFHGLLRIELRSDNQNSTSTTTFAHVSAKWLTVNNKNLINNFSIGIHNEASNWYADLFYKANGTYTALNVKMIDGGSRGNYNRAWTLINCKEPNNATDQSSCTECYANIEDYCSEYTSIITSVLESYVANSLSADSAKNALACTGNSATATKLKTTRKISLEGNVVGEVEFNGSADVVIENDYRRIHLENFSDGCFRIADCSDYKNLETNLLLGIRVVYNDWDEPVYSIANVAYGYEDRIYCPAWVTESADNSVKLFIVECTDHISIFCKGGNNGWESSDIKYVDITILEENINKDKVGFTFIEPYKNDTDSYEWYEDFVDLEDYQDYYEIFVRGTCKTAEYLKTPRYIDGIKFDGSANVTHFCTCSTSASTATKVLSYSGWYSLSNGTTIRVLFTNGSTVRLISTYLKIGSTSTQVKVPNNMALYNSYYIEPNAVVEFVFYNGYFYMVNYMGSLLDKLNTTLENRRPYWCNGLIEAGNTSITLIYPEEDSFIFSSCVSSVYTDNPNAVGRLASCHDGVAVVVFDEPVETDTNVYLKFEYIDENDVDYI